MQPRYGTDVARAMFESQGDAKIAVNEAIRSAIAIWIPEITVEDVVIGELTDAGALMVTVVVLLPDFTTESIPVSSVILNPNGTTTR